MTILVNCATDGARGPLSGRDLASRARLSGPGGRLTVVAGYGMGHSWDLCFTINSIGRGGGNDIMLDFGDRTIHRDPHAAIEVDGKVIRVHDVRKGNPVLVNEKIVDRPCVVTPGDRIRVGYTTLRLDPV